MEKQIRKKHLEIIKDNHQIYVNSLELKEKFEKRFKNLYVKIRNLTRKEFSSLNSLKCIPNIARIIFGIKEDIFRMKLPEYSFQEELLVTNEYLQNAIQQRKVTNYFGKCKYGETLLNIYLDLYICFTTYKTEKEIEAYPDFLVNPLTGSNLELDINFEDFKLAFEFQGEHHYTVSRVIRKDRFKLNECANNDVILIPINISQLSNIKLSTIIINSIKEFLGIHHFIISKAKCSTVPQKRLSSFYKLTQRIYLANILFKPALDILDSWCNDYINNMRSSSPISSSADAPRYIKSNPDLDMKFIYRNLRHVI